MSPPGVVDWGVAAGIGNTLAGTETESGPDPGHARLAPEAFSSKITAQPAALRSSSWLRVA